MVDRAVAHRYAEAYVNALESSKRVEPGLEALKLAAQAYRSSPQLTHFLGSPEIAEEEKRQLIAKGFGELLGPEGMNLLSLLLQWERVDHLPAIAEEAVAVVEERQGIAKGKVVTAHPISSAQVEAMAKALSNRLGKRVLLERKVELELMGGVQISVGTTLLDGSVQRALADVREQLLAVKVT